MRARITFALLFLFGMAFAVPSALAQMTTDDVIDTGPKDEKVEEALSWQRLQTDVKYLRPDTDFRPGEDIQIKIPEPPESPEEEREGDRVVSGLFAVVLIAVVLVILILFGNKINVSFGKTSEARRRTNNDADADGERLLSGVNLPKDGVLNHLAAMADRRQALILLTGLALERAAKANGLTLARAQTARDVLRILPRTWSHIGAMRQLVREAEIVHFGGRDLAEDTWRGCLEAARPLFAGDRARV